VYMQQFLLLYVVVDCQLAFTYNVQHVPIVTHTYIYTHTHTHTHTHTGGAKKCIHILRDTWTLVNVAQAAVRRNHFEHLL
jgi:hypothetical protein